MLATHLLTGSLVGFLVALLSWTAGLPVLATVSVYVVAGNLGVLASAVVEGLRHHRATTAPKERLAMPLVRAQLHSPMSDEEVMSIVVAHGRQGG